MTTFNQNKKTIKKHAKDMLKDSYASMLKKIDKALNSGVIDIDGYDPKDKPMIAPKCILMAILLDESRQYSARGTGYEKKVKREVKNIINFI